MKIKTNRQAMISLLHLIGMIFSFAVLTIFIWSFMSYPQKTTDPKCGSCRVSKGISR